MGIKILTVFLGAEFFPLVRVAPGAGFCLALLASLTVKQWLFQYLPVTEVHAMLLQCATGLSGLYLVMGLFSRYSAWLHGGIPHPFNTGARLLSCFGMVPLRTLLHIVEPVATMIVAGLAMMDVMHLGTVFPWWRQFGYVPQTGIGNPLDVLPALFTEQANLCAMGYAFVAWIAFCHHGRLCDWPESAVYRQEQHAAYEAQAAARGQMTFSTVEEVRR